MMEWLNQNQGAAIVLTLLTSAVGLAFMHGSALRWLRTIANRLDRHVIRNEKQHERIFDKLEEHGKDIAHWSGRCSQIHKIEEDEP